MSVTQRDLEKYGIDYMPSAIGIVQLYLNEYLVDLESCGGDIESIDAHDLQSWLTKQLDAEEDIFLQPK